MKACMVYVAHWLHGRCMKALHWTRRNTGHRHCNSRQGKTLDSEEQPERRNLLPHKCVEPCCGRSPAAAHTQPLLLEVYVERLRAAVSFGVQRELVLCAHTHSDINERPSQCIRSVYAAFQCAVFPVFSAIQWLLVLPCSFSARHLHAQMLVRMRLFEVQVKRERKRAPARPTKLEPGREATCVLPIVLLSDSMEREGGGGGKQDERNRKSNARKRMRTLGQQVPSAAARRKDGGRQPPSQ